MQISIEQRSYEWLLWRKGKIGSSDIATICGLNPYKTARQLYQERIDGVTVSVNPDMARGMQLEPLALSVFNAKLNKLFSPACFVHDSHTFAIASLDGYLDGELVEIKCPRRETLLKWVEAAKIPDMYMAQMQWQMLISGAKRAHFFAFVNDIEFLHLVIEPDITMQLELLDAAMIFLSGEIPLSKDDVQLIEEPSYLAYAQRYEELDAQIEELEVYKDETAAELKKLLVHHSNIQVGRVRIRESEYKGAIDYSKISLLKSIDLEPYRKPSSKRTSITIKRDDGFGA